MPFYEYLCTADVEDHVVEKFFTTFSSAQADIDETICPTHGCIAKRIPSQPFQALLLGNPDGYHRPSPTKRFTTKTVSQKDGNKYSAG